MLIQKVLFVDYINSNYRLPFLNQCTDHLEDFTDHQWSSGIEYALKLYLYQSNCNVTITKYRSFDQ